MRKLFFTIIAILYLGMSSGIAMEVHYCMGKKAGIDFFGDKNDKCSKCGMKEKKGGCCTDKHHFVKIEDSHQKTINNIDFSWIGLDAITPVGGYISFTKSPIITTTASNYSLPNYSPPERCVLHCVFRL